MFVNFVQHSESLKKLLFSRNSEMTENSIFSYSSQQLQNALAEVLLGDSYSSSVNTNDLSFENGEFLSLGNSNNSEVNITDILNEFIQSEEVLQLADVNADGVYSAEEMND